MQRKAAAAGLAIDEAEIPLVAAENWMHPPTDSSIEFLDGVYAKTHPRFYRTLQIGTGLNEVLDESVVSRCRDSADYRPRNPSFRFSDFLRSIRNCSMRNRRGVTPADAVRWFYFSTPADYIGPAIQAELAGGSAYEERGVR